MYQKDDLKIYLIKRKDKDGKSRTKFANFKDTISRFNQCRRDNLFSEKDIEDLLTTKDNGVANVGRFNKVVLTNQQASQNWESIYKTIQEFDFKKDSHEILSKKYIKLLNTVKKNAITNRLLATFFPRYVTATCSKNAFKTIADFMYENFENYQKPQNNWLLDNLDFVKYCQESLGEENYDPLIISYSWDLYEDIENKEIYKLLEDKTMANAKTLAQECAELLKNTKNLILHGAPGTGKTYLAKEKIAPELAGLLGIKKEDVEIGFVQFHPSYDYTDFVEGIRPRKKTSDDKSDFELVSGIFKKFCEKAINNSEHILKNTAAVNSSYRDFLKALKDFVRDFENKIPTHLSESMKFLENKLNALESTSDNVDHNVFKELFLLKIELRWFIEELQTTGMIFDNNLRESFKNLKEKLLNQLNNFNYQNGLHTCWDFLMQEASKHDENKPLKIGNESYFKTSPEVLKRISNNKKEPYLTFERLKEVYEHKDKNKKYKKYKQQCQNIIDYMSNNYKLENYTNEKLEDDVFDEKTPNHSENRNSFVFIIDEINRGELSKIFGELFFSIDPEYRSTKGAILTQYANMADKPNKFDDALGIKEEQENKGNYGHFFVPENVYIIGTMNDIDRSVESMDLAMRRRFTFKEITANNSQEAMLNDSNEKLKGISDKIEALKNRMINLNDKITDSEIGLSKDYQIGAAYFLKFADYYNPKEENSEQTAFKNLWNYNLEPLLREYLRGQGDIESKLTKLEMAYNDGQKYEEKTD